MNEVHAQSAALLLESLERRGMKPVALWSGLPVDVAAIRDKSARIDWPTWVDMMDRVAASAKLPLEELFVPGSGTRSGHPFARVAQRLLSIRDLYAFLARWGVRRAFLTMRASFESLDASHARFGVTIDGAYRGSQPTLQFLQGILTNLPDLQGYPAAHVRATTLTSHAATYELELPRERSLLGRARRFVGALDGVSTTLDELERQAEEIAAKNTELEHQLAEVRDRDEWLAAALDAGRVGLWRWDPEIQRVRISQRLVEWLGTEGQTEIDTAVWGRRIHPEDQPRVADHMRRVIEDPVAFETEYRIVPNASGAQWLRVTGHRHVDASGRLYIYGSAADITDEKLMDSRMRMADRLIAAGTLAAGIAHEINNPLTYVLGSIELVQQRLAPHPAAAAAIKDLISQIIDGVERIRAVVGDVRSFARQDENAVGPVDPRTVCAASIRLVANDVRHRATITTELSPDTPLVSANEAKLGQVLINLIVNASQAMPQRPVDENHVVVRTHPLPMGEVAIEVEDNGTGIAPDVVPQLFDPFFTTKPVGLGTGLGLPVCQGIVASLGGRIDVDTSLGRGSRFTVVLPALRAAAELPQMPPADARPPANGTNGTNGTNGIKHVLIIDDEPLIRNIVVRSLESRGFHVSEAENGVEGLDRALAGDDKQVILCDLMMPGLDGAALYQELSSRRPELLSRVVFISGGAVTDRMRAFIERTDVTVLNKPFGLDNLLAAIEHASRA